MSKRKIIEFYDQFYSSGQTMLVGSAYDQIKYLLPRGKLLDVACGTGEFLQTLPKSVSGCGIDISPAAIQRAKEKLKGSYQLEVAPADGIPFPDDYFDYVTCFGSIEHFENREKSLKEMLRVGKTDCQYVFIVPNSKLNYKTLLNFKTHTFQKEAKEDLFTWQEWKKIFEQAGYVVLHVQ
ncbi:MAG: hypothetical protein A2142_07160, partial [candidate division Zixibacteria bacterium RBG_16_48_11]